MTQHNSGAPSLALLAVEPLRASLDFTAALFASRLPKSGDGHAVLVLPGLGAGDWSTLHLRRTLDRAGFAAHGWGMGINRGPHGDFDSWLDTLIAKLQNLYDTSGGKVSLIGWSLGGIYARELAKRAPHLTRQVITLGTPFAGLQASNAGAAFRLLNGNRVQVSPDLERRLRIDPSVPTTAVYSRTDGVVSWRSCMLRESGTAENIGVSIASHCGLGVHPAVLRIVADRLSQPEGGWRRWDGAIKRNNKSRARHRFSPLAH